MTPIEQLAAAVNIAGPNPQHHGSLMSRHELEWPTLWKAIHRIIREELPKERMRQAVPGDALTDQELVVLLREDRTAGLIAMSQVLEKLAEIREITTRASVDGLAADAMALLNPLVPEQARRSA